MTVKCYWMEPLGKTRLSLRRYVSSEGSPCPSMPGKYSYHNAKVFLFDVDEKLEGSGDYKVYRHEGPQNPNEVPPEYVQLWPEFCDCGYVFKDEDRWQIFSETLYQRSDTGQILTWTEAGPGAMRENEWFAGKRAFCGPDGISISVKCPDGKEWMIDGPCNNCTMPNDHVHKCWVRHGNPPYLTVNKQGGYTCNAGGGSIDTGTYHGFLVEGVFTNA